MATRIFVPQRTLAIGLERLRELGDVEVFDRDDRPISKEELLAAVSDKEILYAFADVPFERDVIDAARQLELIAAEHTRASFVDIAAATARGIPVSGTPVLNRNSVAELTVALLIGLAWRIPEADRHTRAGLWRQSNSVGFLTTELAGTTVGMVGFGRIGRAVARRLRPFSMDVLYHKRTPLSVDEERESEARYAGLEELFERSDFVVVTCPLTDQTHRLIDRRLLELMRSTAFLINVSRGEILVEDDLIAALQAGGIAGAGLDVYEREIPNPGAGPHPALLGMSNVILTPHIGSAARATRERMVMATVASIEAFLRGDRPAVVLNPEVYGEAARVDERWS